MEHVPRELSNQLRRSWPLVAIVLAAGALVLAATVVVSRAVGESSNVLLGDPLEVLDMNPLVGAVSNLGITLWSAAAGICFLAALVLGREPASRPVARFFFWSGAFTVLLTADDLYQLHEIVLPALLGGRGQTAILAGYLVLAAVFVWWFRRRIRATEYLLFLSAGACFALSIGIDVLPRFVDVDESDIDLLFHVGEDGAKLVGIGFWLAYFAHSAAAVLRPATGAGMTGAG